MLRSGMLTHKRSSFQEDRDRALQRARALEDEVKVLLDQGFYIQARCLSTTAMVLKALWSEG